MPILSVYLLEYNIDKRSFIFFNLSNDVINELMKIVPSVDNIIVRRLP